jgi:hypothetical protein
MRYANRTDTEREQERERKKRYKQDNIEKINAYRKKYYAIKKA